MKWKKKDRMICFKYYVYSWWFPVLNFQWLLIKEQKRWKEEMCEEESLF